MTCSLTERMTMMKKSTSFVVSETINLVATTVSAAAFNVGAAILASAFRNPLLSGAIYIVGALGSIPASIGVGELAEAETNKMLLPFITEDDDETSTAESRPAVETA